MAEATSNFLKSISSHVLVVLLTALVTISLALGSYRTKIDTLLDENTDMKKMFAELSLNLNDLRIEVAGLRGEMRQERIDKRYKQ